MLRLDLRKVRIHWDVLRSIAVIGIPAGVQGMLFNFSNVLIQGGINSLGATAIAANTVSLNYDYFCFFVANAFAQQVPRSSVRTTEPASTVVVVGSYVIPSCWEQVRRW